MWHRGRRLEEPERSARLAALEEQLPKAVREARRRASEPVRVRKEVRRLREGGADSAEVFALREAAFGTEAAERLAALDEERGAWEARLDEYRSARASLLAEMGYSPDAGLAEIDLPRADRDRLDALRREHFDDSEQPRVRLLDQMR